jgi:hypothetical protein
MPMPPSTNTAIVISGNGGTNGYILF